MLDGISPAWPVKTRELHTLHLKSTRWNGFKFRGGDIVIATYAKSGTTWTQQIVGQLLHGGAEGINVSKLSPWVEQRLLPDSVLDVIEAQTARRFVKCHLPADALVYSPKAKYIHVGRDGRDVAWSFQNHDFNGAEAMFERYNAARPEGVPLWERGPADPREYYARWFAQGSYPLWPFWDHIRSWWALRGLPNLLTLNYADMKRDLPGSIRRIARFLDIAIDEANWPAILEHCSFAHMKENADQIAPLGGVMWKGGGKTFINKGVNGRWREALSEAEVAAYEARAVAELGPECAAWLANGAGG